MTITLLQAPVGAGKTEAALNRLAKLIAPGQKPFARAWVLLATRRQEVAFRQRLAQLPNGQPALFNIEFFNFYDLYRRLLNIAGQPQRHLQASGGRGLLRHVVRELADAGELQHFRTIAGQTGFVSILAEFIAELKQNHIEPQLFTNAVQMQKDHELALIYARYQEVLQKYALVDQEGEGWLAAVELANQLQQGINPLASVDLLLIDGYDQFTPVQTNILTLLGQQIETLITLTRLPMDMQGHPPPVGRRFEQTYQTLTQALNAAGVPFRVEVHEEPKTRHEDLSDLSKSLGGQIKPLTRNTERISMIEAPDQATETAALLRRVKWLLLNGAVPDDILIVLRDLNYQPYIEAYARLYRIPLLSHYVKSIATNPAVTLLMDALKLNGLQFPRRETLDVLRSPYIFLPEVTPELLTKLDIITTERQVLKGAQNWLNAIRSATEDVDQLDDEDEEHDYLKLTEAEVDILYQAIQSFFELVSPPAEAPLREYVMWLENLIGSTPEEDDDADPDFAAAVEQDLAAKFSLHIAHRVQAMAENEDTDTWLTARDIQALNTFKEILRGLLQTQDLLRAIDPDLTHDVAHWDDLFIDLIQMVKASQEPQRSPVRTGRVLVTTVTDARGLPHQHVFIPGLAEGIFPAPVAEDPLYLDTERELLSQRGVPLEARFERAADHSLFYEIVSQSHASLTISRPTAREGKPWPASHLWRLVQQAYPALLPQIIRTDAAIAPQEASSGEEVLLSVAHAIQTNTLTDDVISLAAWLARASYDEGQEALHDAWAMMRHNSAIERGRIMGQTAPEYDGLLTQPTLAAEIREKAKGWKWSANRLKNYGECGYKFFAHYLLSLEKLQEPKAEIKASTRGTLYHAILEKLYGQIRAESLAITAAQCDYALRLLDDYAAEVFESAPGQYGFIPPAQWESEREHYMTQLRTFVMTDFSDESPLNKFGARRYPIALEETFTETVQLYGKPVRVTGTIDRVDRDAETQALIIVDYKSSRRPSKRDMKEGSNVQMLIYARALQTMVEQERYNGSVRAGVFWSVANNLTEVFDFEKDDILDILDQGEAHVQDHIAGIHQARFPINPIGPSACEYCDFNGGLCRIAQRPRVKAKAGE